VARLRAEGAIILGKTNVAEMAAAYDTENPLFGHANNPHDLSRTAGGSSGGEGAAIAACLSAGGIGSDLMGSVRVPAHFCGITSLKPTSGRVPGEGHIPISAGILAEGAVIGPMARNVEDLEILFDVLSGNAEQTKDRRKLQEQMISAKVRVACYTVDGVSPVTGETIHAVESAAANAAAQQIASEYRGRESEAGPLVRHLLESTSNGRSDFEIDLRDAITERDNLRARIEYWMSETPYIITPVGAAPAFQHGARKIDVEGESITVFRGLVEKWSAHRSSDRGKTQ
jgi:Asp-tRNA(Asn)/Glu-tRNA(Gln) amidotransferase A subunit family amidase